MATDLQSLLENTAGLSHELLFEADLSGALLLVNQFWQWLRGQRKPTPAGRFVGCALTFVAFSVGGVFFRAVDIETAWHLLVSMAGLGAPGSVESLSLDADKPASFQDTGDPGGSTSGKWI